MARNGAIYVGNDAEIEFERRSGRTNAKLLRSNVSSTERFSFDFADSILQTGDRVRISRMDQDANNQLKDLVLQDGVTNSNNIEHYCYVDNLGRIYLYSTLTNALNERGGTTGRIDLTQGSVSDWEQDKDASGNNVGEPYQRIQLELRDDGFKDLAKCMSYELTTNRDTVDCTVLGKYFYDQWENGLVGGQGTITAIWDDQIVETTDCQDPYINARTDELAAYFAKLILRIQIGAGFRGKFFLKSRDDERMPSQDKWAVWWQADCVCTNVAVQATPDAFLQARIEFITNGLFQLEISDRRSTTSLANNSGLLLETEGDGGLLLTE